jgi:hypothetical protein
MPQDDPDIKEVLATLLPLIGRSLPRSELVRIRRLFDDPTFLIALKKLLSRLHNDTDERVGIITSLTEILRSAEEFRDKRESQRGLIGQMAVGAASGLIVAGAVAMLNPAIGLFALAAIVGGAGIGGVGWTGARRLDDERSVYKQIADRLAVILKAVDT